MTVWALIPAKDAARAKSRLARSLSPQARRTFALRTLRHVVGAAVATGAIDRCVVISAAQEVLEVAAAAGATPLRELPPARRPAGAGSGVEQGLNSALAQGIQLAVAGGASAVLLMAADLPLVDPATLTTLVDCLGKSDGVVLAPDRHGQGTNALVIRPPRALPPAFGPDSLRRHRELALARGLEVRICSLEGLALDVDTEEDVREFVRARRRVGDWESECLEWFGGGSENCLSPCAPDRAPRAGKQGEQAGMETCAYGR